MNDNRLLKLDLSFMILHGDMLLYDKGKMSKFSPEFYKQKGA